MNNGIWIRTQDKKAFYYCDSMSVKPADQKMVKPQDEYNHMAGWVDDENGRWGIATNRGFGFFAGVYSTKEKAIAVLNCIQRHVFLEDDVFVMPEDDSPNFKCEGGEIRYVD